MRTKTLLVVACALVAAACTGSPTVAEVNGELITADDVNALSADPPEGPVIPGDPFRADLDLLIINAALRTAARDQFGASGFTDPDRLASKMGDPSDQQAGVFAAIEADPSRSDEYAAGAAQFFLIRDAALAELDPAGELDAFTLEDRFAEWFAAAIEAADVEISSQVGVWDRLSVSVLPPP